ncbi:putative autotransporter serine protease [Campylobacter pinnipediorum subsp. pinnipediorum]|uniref:S8 family serine peptidase n=1 Tax=Campylobacter pinnipediorum TaxID=1965231 RepID=UPI0009C34337|nr:S8 family serine peptidase [Campylobacter pinnipediorum]AQW80823.1 putative autotransporter serine protease [Campylobacter pinnipediorum subsp. pinnipediorum]
MKTTKTTLLATSVVTILLAGCGGGGGGGGSSTSTNYYAPSSSIGSTPSSSRSTNDTSSNTISSLSVSNSGEMVGVAYPLISGPVVLERTTIQAFRAMIKNVLDRPEHYSNSKSNQPLTKLNDHRVGHTEITDRFINTITDKETRPNSTVSAFRSNSFFRSANFSSPVTLASSHNDNEQLRFNTGYLDTSHKWNSRQKIEQAFSWNRLNRIRNGAKVAINNQSLIDNANDVKKLSSLINNGISKILVTDNYLHPNNVSTIDRLKREKRFEAGSIIKDRERLTINKKISDNNNKPSSTKGTSHLEEMIVTIAGKQDRINNRTPGMFIDNGKVYAFESNLDFSSMVNSTQFSKAIKDGYNIINASWAYPVEKNFRTKGEDVTWTTGFEDLGEAKRDNETWLEFVQRKKLGDNSIVRSNTDIVIKKLNDFVKTDDILFIKATGNDNNEKTTFIPYYVYLNKNKEEVKYLYNSLLMVGAIDPDTGFKAKYSNNCGDFKEFCLVASGTLSYQSQYNNNNNTYLKAEGTSYAAPYVASAAGLVKSVFPFMTNDNIKQTLLTTAKDLGKHGIDDVYGWGLVQPQIAIEGPMKFYKKDFVVDFGHNEKFLSNRQVFNFSNDIDGDSGLVIKGGNTNNVLSLSGKNTYNGRTRLKDGAILNVDGIVKSKIHIDNNSHLYGSGVVGNVLNNGFVHNYSYDTVTNRNSRFNGLGMLIKGNYRQTSGASLYVYLGQPLLVEGYADIEGNLVVNGVKTGYVSKYGKIFEDVLASKSGITGKFDKISVPGYLSNPEAYYNSLHNQDGLEIYTVSIFSDYAGHNPSSTPIRTSAITNLVTLNNAVETKIEKAVDKAKEKEPNLDKVETAVVANNEVLKLEQTNTSVMQLLAEAQSDSSTAIKLAKKLDGSEYLTSIKRSNKIDDINSFNTLNNKQDGFGYEFIKNEKDNINIVSYGSKKQSHEFSAKINYTTDNDFKQNGMNLNYYNSDFKVGFGLGYSATNEKIYGDNTTNGNKLKQNTYQTAIYAKDSISFGSSNISGLFGVELLRKTIKDINGDLYNLPKQNLNNTNLLLGLNYQLTNPFDIRDISFNLGYLYKKQLNKNKALVGRALDSAKLTFNDREKRRDTHILSTGISKQFGKFNLGVDYNLYKARDKKAENGFRVSASYAF